MFSTFSANCNELSSHEEVLLLLLMVAVVVVVVVPGFRGIVTTTMATDFSLTIA